MQIILSYIYEFTKEVIRFDILFFILTSLFYLKDHNNLYFYKLSHERAACHPCPATSHVMTPNLGYFGVFEILLVKF